MLEIDVFLYAFDGIYGAVAGLCAETGTLLLCGLCTLRDNVLGGVFPEGRLVCAERIGV